MADYTKTTNFLAKDSLPLNNAAKYVKGSEIDTEFNNIATADADNLKVSALGTGVETFLGTPSSANLAAAITDETGTGVLVFGTSPTIASPTLSGVTTVGDGSAAAPSIVSSTGSADTGFWFPAADTLAASTGGVERWRLDSNGSYIGNVAAGAEPFRITAAGAATNHRHRLNTSAADSSVAYCLSNSNGAVNKQSSAVLSATGILTYYINQAAAADSTSGTACLSFATDGTITQVAPALIGYGTGAGGTVTQDTSRTTTVVINKPCGAITLFSAAGSTSWQSFTVSNSLVAATDTIIVNQKSGTDLHMLHVTAVGAGSFRISFATISGTTTEQPVFNFAVIKAVTS